LSGSRYLKPPALPEVADKRNGDLESGRFIAASLEFCSDYILPAPD
jgi:hypothetical protein